MKKIQEILPSAKRKHATHPSTQPAIPNIHRLAGLNEFKTANDRELERVKLAGQRFASEMLDYSAPRWLSLLGASGVGKTFMARQLMDLARRELGSYRTGYGWEQPRLIRWINWRKLADDLRSGEYWRVEWATEPWLAVIDDLGAEQHSPFLAAKMDRIINERLRKWTIITANFTLAEISETLDRRIASRMIRDGNRAVEINAKDWALRR